MSITILNYYDQALVDAINAQAAQRAEAARAEAEAANIAASQSSFSDVLSQATESYAQSNTSNTAGSEDLTAIFEEAANTFGVSVNLLQSIAKAESNFNTTAVSSAGAVGIMQLMPATAAAMGVTDSYDAYQNIMGGAKYIAQLLQTYSGNISLALAAYNAGSANVNKYGGIPPFTETQNYVKKVLYYLENGISNDYTGTTNSSTDTSALGQTLANLLTGSNLSNDTLDALSALIQTLKTDDASDNSTSSSANAATENTATVDTTEAEETSRAFTVTVLNDTDTL